MLFQPVFWFLARMVFWSCLALTWPVLVLSVVARLDLAFFEAADLLRSPGLREAFSAQAFQVDPVFFGMLGTGFVIVVVSSTLFCRTRFEGFRRLTVAFQSFAQNGQVPPVSQMGPFVPHTGYFFDVIARRMSGANEQKTQAVLEDAVRDWPRQPRTTWAEQAQFVVAAGLPGLVFSVLCAVFCSKAVDRIAELLTGVVARFNGPAGLRFFAEQAQIVDLVVWPMLGLVACGFAVSGYKLGQQIAEANYAILRDMRLYLEGNYERRIVVRRSSPVHSLIEKINRALESISAEIMAKEASSRGSRYPSGQTPL